MNLVLQNGIYAFFIVHILHLKLIDYRNLLLSNGQETIRKCQEFLNNAFNNHILDTYIIQRRNGIQEFSNRLIDLQGYLEALPRKGDCKLWNKETQSFKNEIVRYGTNMTQLYL